MWTTVNNISSNSNSVVIQRPSGILSFAAILVIASGLVSCSGSEGAKAPDPKMAEQYKVKPAKMNNADVVSAGGALCSVDVVNKQQVVGNLVRVSKKSPLEITGWVYTLLDKEPVTPLAYVMLKSDTEPQHYLEAQRQARPDVAAAYKNQLLGNAGFMMASSISAVSPGTYKLEIITGDAVLMFVCPTNILVQVTE